MPQLKQGFTCANCTKFVLFQAPGTKNRNHCPFCLASLHVDIIIGDRKSHCHGIMFAVAKTYKPDGEEVIIHKCEKCLALRKNRVAGDDSEQLIQALKTVERVEDLLLDSN